VVDDPRVSEFEELYHNDVVSLAVLPFKIDSAHRAAIYLVNPLPDQLQAPAGGPVLLAYQNLISLTLPRAIQASRPANTH